MAALLALFIRSLRDDLRSRALLWTRTGMAVAVLFAVFKARVIYSGLAPGLDFFDALAWMNVAFIAVAGLSYFASAITEEKEEGTLGLLRMTDLSPVAILLGKSTSRFVGGALMLLVQFPFALLAITLGGVHIDQVLGSYALLLAMLFFTCNAGLLASVVSRRTGVAGVCSAIVMTAWSFVIAGVELTVSYFGASVSAAVASSSGWLWVRPCAKSPFDAMDELLDISGANFPIAGQCVWLVLGGLVCFGAALGLFNRFCTEAGDGTAAKTVRGIISNVTARTARTQPRRANGDALVWKDFHFLHGGNVVIWIKTAIYFTGTIWILGEFTNSIFGGTQLAFTVVFTLSLLVISLESAFAASRIYRVEAKDKTLAALLILPRDLDSIIRAKRRAIVQSLLPAFAALGIASLALTGPFLSGMVSNGYFVFFATQILALLIAQFYFNLRLVAWFSLRMKWGGLPTALALIWVGNSIVIPLTWLIFREAASLFFLIVGTVVASQKLKRALRRRIEQAAAEE